MKEADDISLKEGMTSVPGTFTFAVLLAWLLYKYVPAAKRNVTLFVNIWREQRNRQEQVQGQSNVASSKKKKAKSKTDEGASGGIEMKNFPTSDSAGASGDKTKPSVNDDKGGASGDNVDKPSKTDQNSGAGPSSKSDETYLQPVVTSKEGPTSILKKKSEREVRQIVNEIGADLEKSNPEYEKLLSPAKRLRERRAKFWKNRTFPEKLYGSDSICIEDRFEEDWQSVVNSWKLEDGKAVGGAKSKVPGKLRFGAVTSTPYKSFPSENDDPFYSMDTDPELGTSPLDTSQLSRNRSSHLDESFTSKSKSDDDLYHSKKVEEEFHGDLMKHLQSDLEFKSPDKRKREGLERDLLETTKTLHDKTCLQPFRNMPLVNISAENESDVIDTNMTNVSESLENFQSGATVQVVQAEVHPHVEDREIVTDEGSQFSSGQSETNKSEMEEEASHLDTQVNVENAEEIASVLHNEENSNQAGAAKPVETQSEKLESDPKDAAQQSGASKAVETRSEKPESDPKDAAQQSGEGKPVETQSEKPESDSKDAVQQSGAAKTESDSKDTAQQRKPRKRKDWVVDLDRKRTVGNRNKSRDRNN